MQTCEEGSKWRLLDTHISLPNCHRLQATTAACTRCSATKKTLTLADGKLLESHAKHHWLNQQPHIL